MNFTLAANRWCGWQMVPGCMGELYVPYFSPIHIRGVRAMKQARDLSKWIT